ncbi:Subtilisin-like protease SBT3.16 [Clarias magur]|uniref:Subtilisin-like protease SBT3.16 n=1 Tax=Clarias magur TaxID=1594786 RepID=A0A8J4TYK9_CLAMG|nr:Subtilisin-like protease SBT3.16 [Clarias magur]
MRLQQIDGGNHSWRAQCTEQQGFNEVSCVPSFIQAGPYRKEHQSSVGRHHHHH